jgi:hypothetical protein
VLIERETVDKDQLEALLEDRWDQYLKDEVEKKAAGGDASQESDEVSEDQESEEDSAQSAEPPMAPGTPPVLDS